MEHEDEKRIVDRILQGDRQSYALLVEEYKVPIHNLACRMTGNAEDAADLTQDIFIRAYTHLWRYNPKKKFFTWLYTIALNTIKNHLKKNRRYREIQRYDPGRESNEKDHWPAGEEITAGLSKLDADTRVMIVMRYQQELSFEEISEITGKSLSAVKMRVYRGLEQLKIMLEKNKCL